MYNHNLKITSPTIRNSFGVSRLAVSHVRPQLSHLDHFAISAAAEIVILSVLVSHLSAALSATVLSSLDETGIPIHTHNPVI